MEAHLDNVVTNCVGSNFIARGNTTYKIQEQKQIPQQNQNQIQTQQIKEIQNNPYLPAEPNFITRFTN